MKKLFVILSILLVSVTAKSQQLSYGIVLGANFYGSGNNNGANTFTTSGKYVTPNLGGYAEYGFNEKMGAKIEFTFNKKEVEYVPLSYSQTKAIFKMAFFEISPSFKYDFGNEYRRGFYMFLGPKFAFVTSAELDGVDASDAFKKNIFGVQLGLGHRVLKFIDIQTKFNYDVTPFFKLDNGNQSKFFGAYLSLNVDLEKIINK